MRGLARLVWTRSWALLVLAMLGACGEDDEWIEVGAGEQTEGFCEASCTRDLQCGRPDTLEACQDFCEANVSGLENIRPEAVEVAANCILDIPCSRFYDEMAFVPCWERAEREVEPNRPVRRFCQAWSSRWFECGFTYPVAECEKDWAINSASYLERISTCMDRPCASLEECALEIQAGGGG